MKSTFYRLLLFTLSCCLLSCGQKNKKQDTMNKKEDKSFEKGSFGYDYNFIKKRDTSLIVLANGNSQVLVSPKYQAKVFTSTANGQEGKSFGWVNYAAFDKEENSHMNAYGGENRFWLGPEGSKFSLFFKPGKKMVYDNWHTPAAVDTEAWKVASKTANIVHMEKEMALENFTGTQLHILAKRNIEILKNNTIQNMLNIGLDSIQAVGFTSENSITNTGEQKWTKETGAPCIWILDMFTPSNKTVIVVPFNEAAQGKVATTDYFGEIDKDRLKYRDGKILFQADGKSRGKLGVPPHRAKNTTGSYDPVNSVLTITRFEVAQDSIYLNQEWTPDKDPLVGDAVNAYNDGPLEDGSQMGPFYEIESVSPAAFLAPQETLSHKHSVFHFTGDEAKLDKISIQLLGIALQDIKKTF